MSAAPDLLRTGLSADEAARHLAADGPNEIARADGTPAWKMLLAQFASPLVLLLVGACVVSVVLGEVVDAVAIAAIVGINGLIGFYQEYSAQNAVLRCTHPHLSVVRGTLEGYRNA